MIDFGFDKLALIGAVALIVIGPEKLPRVARTVGHLLGKAQRYVSDVKAEVNRSIELEELQKMKSQFESAARDVEHTVHQEMSQVSGSLENAWQEPSPAPDGPSSAWAEPPPQFRPVKKNWRVKRTAVPRWYKQQSGQRQHVQSGAARVARFRPPGRGAKN
ncbi:Sec-independent protein translocase protein TatB [Ideonella livida]|uniref:Sec-independent protein translocase protein TatB n=1 Tax=Ideonella livida TaxID=2707176 RepID=A0A7C9TGH0_9BURK|nr:Sec-independent protein translocase protein TatB [Ideonella livida]NDY89658.1 Sec-independent protein translocase subunit TatB [Ideonella livida]